MEQFNFPKKRKGLHTEDAVLNYNKHSQGYSFSLIVKVTSFIVRADP